MGNSRVRLGNFCAAEESMVVYQQGRRAVNRLGRRQSYLLRD